MRGRRKKVAICWLLGSFAVHICLLSTARTSLFSQPNLIFSRGVEQRHEDYRHLCFLMNAVKIIRYGGRSVVYLLYNRWKALSISKFHRLVRMSPCLSNHVVEFLKHFTLVSGICTHSCLFFLYAHLHPRCCDCYERALFSNSNLFILKFLTYDLIIINFFYYVMDAAGKIEKWLI